MVFGVIIDVRINSTAKGPTMKLKALIVCLALSVVAGWAGAATADGKHKLVIIAGKPSHPPRQHEFRAGTLLLAKCLKDVPGLVVDTQFNGWVADEKTFDDA